MPSELNSYTDQCDNFMDGGCCDVDGCACVVLRTTVKSLEIGWWAGSDEISWLVGFGGREVKRVF